MKKIFSLILLTLFSSLGHGQETDSSIVNQIYSETLNNAKAYDWLRSLCFDVGHRLSGSVGAEKAVVFAEQMFKEAGADTVWLQEVMVPHWVRGKKEIAQIIDSKNNAQNVPVLALGRSVATPKEGIRADVIEVYDFDELKQLGEEKIKGKIVFFNHPFNESYVNTFAAYSEAGKYRWAAPSEAARYGAVATICRSMTNTEDDFPHTGAMGYNDSLPKIPCAAISTNAANLLSRILKADSKTQFFLQMDCRTLDSVLSYNVIAEMKGSEFPEEFISVGGHLDSWDVGHGAHDDGAGVVQGIEIIRTFKALKIKPKRTIRVVAWMNEENGVMGGKVYAEEAARKIEKHIAAIESDAGAFAPYGFGLDMETEKQAKIKAWMPLFRRYNIWHFDYEHGGTDIGPLQKHLNTPLIGLVIESQRYFDVHHAASDTFDKINKRELHLGAAAMGAMVYLLSQYGL
ncbi:MAG TPA: M20/M25/M40 family metallo-hydrolase [Bacteroidia bacterium]|nr:M20/M25/M40 family metallo-hydrolase [Bacteroidia bacterium]